jgi:putative ABC transport system substrate-binding protein
VKRRDFITLFSSAVAALPLAARAQQSAMPVIGFLNSGSPGPFAPRVTAFRDGLKQSGYDEGRNVAIEFRWAENQLDRLPALAAELVRRQVAVIAATGGDATTRAAKAATRTIPIVFTVGGDPVRDGFVASLSRPGGNMTGAALLIDMMEGKRLGLLHELIPRAASIGVLLNPKNPAFELQRKEVENAARTLGVRVEIMPAASDGELDAAFVRLAKLRVGALLVGADPTYLNRRQRLVSLAARLAIPASYASRPYALAGGLMSYGSRISDGYRQAGIYAGRILTGERPADLPVVQVDRFEFVINLNTAKTLGVEIPPTLSARADEVIE